MMVNHNEKSLQDYQQFCKGKKNLPESQIRVLSLIWGLVQILFRHGNRLVYYHICGQGDTWDVPMEAEGLSVRTAFGEKKVTLW